MAEEREKREREAGTVGVFTTDRAFVVRSWDSWLARATGVSEAEALGRSLFDLFPDVAARGFEPRLRRVVDQGTVEVFAPAFHAYLIRCAPAAPSAHFARMQQHVTVEPLRSDDAIDGVVVTISDVTARLEGERDLAAALASEDEAVREQAEELLSRDEDAAVTTLSGALGDTRWRVRRAAAERLAAGPPSAAAALVAVLRERHRDPAALNAALSGLAGASHDVVPELLAVLADPDAELRTYAALALGHLCDVRAVPSLVAAVDDPDTNVRQHAIEALGRIGDPDAADALVAVAETRDFYLAFVALDALGAIGEPTVAPRLLPLLDDELLGQAAAEALARVGDEHVASPIAGLLGNRAMDAGAIAAALAALHARLDAHGTRNADANAGARVEALVRAAVTGEGGRALVRAVERAEPGELSALTRVLGWLDLDGVESHLARLLAQGPARHAATDALARRGLGAVDVLVKTLDDADAEVRKAAAATLGRVGSARAIDALVRALGDEPGVAIVAAGALGAIGDSAAYEPLLALFDHGNPAVRQASVAALNSISHPDMPARIHALLLHPSARVRESAARVAGYFGYPACLDSMVALAGDLDETVRRVAVEHLAYFEDPRATQVVAAANGGDPSPSVRAAAAKALSHVAPDAALSPLLTSLHDADMWVRYHAARSLGSQRSVGTVAALAELARADASPPVRVAAIEALAEIGTPEVAAALLPLIGDTEPEVADAARRSLARVAGGAPGEAAGRHTSEGTGDRTAAR